ncbi:MAG: ATP-dependent Clp protease ATP-binding subunit ClpA, partial [Proteobacteria bacterium]|nr:ATP-dependent Clp protease ATP-binding subunit ClpA [Pseudomonadota bacterium]
FLAELNDQLAERKVTVSVSKEARTRLAKLGYDPAFGARPMARVIQTEIKDAIADNLLFGDLTKGGEVEVKLARGAAKSPIKLPDFGTTGHFKFIYTPRHSGSQG